MSLFAGIVFWNARDASALDSAAASLSESLVGGGARAVTRRFGPAVLAWSGWGYGGCHDAGADGVTLLAGRPLPRGDSTDEVFDPGRDVARMHVALSGPDVAWLGSLTGVFCAVRWDPSAARLRLVTDRLGIRPLYVCRGDGMVAFSTRLRTLLSLPHVARHVDMRGTLELVAFGYSLAERTPYSDIALLRGGALLEIVSGEEHLGSTGAWSEGAPDKHEQWAPAIAHSLFVQAVRRRLAGRRAATAYLSGGLDSRCVVAALRHLDTRVSTFNFSVPESMDRSYAERFAAAIGTTHTTSPLPTDRAPDFAALLRSAMRSAGETTNGIEHGVLTAWSGDGGSVSVGHVYFDETLLSALSASDPDRAIRTFAHQQGVAVPVGLIAKVHRARAAEVVVQGVLHELERERDLGMARAFHRFLMNNDQRRHLQLHFETIGDHRVELELPFFDTDFLDFLFRLPATDFTFHRFYHRWLRCFQPALQEVPWQSYRGHEPVTPSWSEDPSLVDQWQLAARPVARLRRAREALGGLRLLRYARRLGAVISLTKLAGGCVAHALGIRDCRHALSAADTMSSILACSSGRAKW